MRGSAPGNHATVGSGPTPLSAYTCELFQKTDPRHLTIGPNVQTVLFGSVASCIEPNGLAVLKSRFRIISRAARATFDLNFAMETQR